eukprot:m.349778 g.349778  ORF g.349778 m.349778 type:complete len:118 (-) comp27955_c2_seq7:2986-3339(-)
MAGSASAAVPGAKGFASARQIFATGEDGELAYRLQGEEWVDTKEGNQFRSTTVRKDVKVARREQMTEEELLIFHRQQYVLHCHAMQCAHLSTCARVCWKECVRVDDFLTVATHSTLD